MFQVRLVRESTLQRGIAQRRLRLHHVSSGQLRARWYLGVSVYVLECREGAVITKWNFGEVGTHRRYNSGCGRR
jgi:hypothetical protein